MEEKKKYRILLLLVFILILVCVVQGFFLLRDSEFKPSWRKEKDNNFDVFSQSLLDKYRNNKKDY